MSHEMNDDEPDAICATEAGGSCGLRQCGCSLGHDANELKMLDFSLGVGGATIELTDENLDYPDCIPPMEHNSIEVKTPAWMQQLIDQRKAQRAARAKTATADQPPHRSAN